MILTGKSILLKDGSTAILRSPTPADAESLLEILRITAGETRQLSKKAS